MLTGNFLVGERAHTVTAFFVHERPTADAPQRLYRVIGFSHALWSGTSWKPTTLLHRSLEALDPRLRDVSQTEAEALFPTAFRT